MAGRRTKRPIPPGLPQDDPRDLYVQKGMSQQAIADYLKGRAGCSRMQIQRRCKVENWAKLRSDWEAKRYAETDARSAVTEAEHRAASLSRIRKVERAAADALEKLLPRIESGVGLLGEKQGIVTAVKEIAQTLESARDAASELVDDRDDRFAALLAYAEEVAGEAFSDVEDLNAEEQELEAMTPRGLEDLARRLTGAPAEADPTAQAS